MPYTGKIKDVRLDISTHSAGGLTGTATIRPYGCVGDSRFLIRTWIANADLSEPDAQTNFSVSTGELMNTIEANADLEVITNSVGIAVVSIETSGATTVYIMAETNGKIYSCPLTTAL